MATRHLYIARHGEADPFGELTEPGRRQSRLLGERLSRLPIDAVWHSPLPRARDSAAALAHHLASTVPVSTAAELIDHVPHVPSPAETPAPWLPFFDGYDPDEAAAEQAVAQRLTDRFAAPLADAGGDSHEVLITHAYAIAWLLRDALGAPPVAWLGHNSANTALTVIEYRPALPPSLVMFNDMAHLPKSLRWTGFPGGVRP